MYADGVSKKTQILSQKEKKLGYFLFSALLLQCRRKRPNCTHTCLENNGNVEDYSVKRTVVTRQEREAFTHVTAVLGSFLSSLLKDEFKGIGMWGYCNAPGVVCSLLLLLSCVLGPLIISC